jgi:two-component system, NarL family, nitrate/nitrite response regulator NarL
MVEGIWMDHVTTVTKTRKESSPRVVEELTAREIEIIRMIAKGFRNKEIAEALFISEGTVKVHLHSIFTKLRLHNRLALALYARDRDMR